MKPWKQRFGKDRWQALYDLGFQGKEEGSLSFVFLWRLASSFVQVLLTSPLFPFEGKDGGFAAGRGAKKAHVCDSRRAGRGMGG